MFPLKPSDIDNDIHYFSFSLIQGIESGQWRVDE